MVRMVSGGLISRRALVAGAAAILPFMSTRAQGQTPPPLVTPITAIAADGWQATYPEPPIRLPGTETVTIIRQGFTTAGAVTTFADPVNITSRVRQPGGDTPTADSVALSDYIYSGDVIADVTNNSTLAYPYAQFAWLVRDRQEVKGSTVFLRIAVAHRHARSGKPVAAVRFIVKDHLGTEADLLVTACTAHRYPVSGLTASVYEGTVDISTLSAIGTPSGDSNAKTFTIDAEFRPWIGTAHKISDITAGHTLDRNTSLTFANNRNNWRPTVYAYVAPGANGGAVDTDPAVAATTPFPDDSAASVAVRNWYDTNVGRGALDGGVIRLQEGTHTKGTWPRTTCDIYPITIEGAPGTNPELVIYQDDGVSRGLAQTYANMFALRNLTVNKVNSNASRMFTGSITVTSLCFLENVRMTGGTGGIIDRYDARYFEGVNMINVLSSCDKMVGCVSNANTTKNSCLVANHMPSGRIAPGTSTTANGLFAAWNQVSNDKTTAINVLALGANIGPLGVAIAGNVLEEFGNGSGPAVNINGDGNTFTSANINMIGNTIVGNRMNFCYTDAGGAARHDHYAALRFNILFEKNHKAGDFFAYQGEETNAARVGNWGIRYGVSERSNTTLRGESRPNGTSSSAYPRSWFGDILPAGSTSGAQNTPLTVTFVDDRSGFGSTLGGGDYTPLVTHDLATIPAGLTPWPVDLLGRPIAADGSAFAGAIQQEG